MEKNNENNIIKEVFGVFFLAIGGYGVLNPNNTGHMFAGMGAMLIGWLILKTRKP